MELRQLRYFVETAHRRSITKAASALHIVQPALTAQIKALEDELGTQLLERSARGVSLTVDGEAVLRDAVAILRAVDDLKRRHAAAAHSGRAVKIGIPNGMTRTFAGQLIERARQQCSFDIELIEGMSGHLLEWLKSGRLDIAVLFASQPLRQLEVRRLTADSIDLVGPPGALDAQRPVAFRDLTGYPLILPNAKHGLTRHIQAQARAQGSSCGTIRPWTRSPRSSTWSPKAWCTPCWRPWCTGWKWNRGCCRQPLSAIRRLPASW